MTTQKNKKTKIKQDVPGAVKSSFLLLIKVVLRVGQAAEYEGGGGQQYSMPLQLYFMHSSKSNSAFFRKCC